LTTLDSDFEISTNLGRGNFSIVHLGIKKKDKISYAIKSIYKEKILNKIENIESIINEIKALRKLNHPHIIKLHEVYESDKYIHLVFEYLKGGELFEIIDERGVFSESEAQSLIKSMVETLSYVHSQKIIHRDLKPENIILQDRNDLISYKIADFGLSTFLENDEKQYLRCGSPGFVSPESLNKEGYDFKVDVFALGVITHILLTGFPPFQRNTYKDTILANKECKVDFDFPVWNNVSIESKNFVKKILEKDPNQRYSSSEAMKDPWFLIKLKNIGSIFDIVDFKN